ncbi:HU family DNA-binding protein [Iocasia frigidifontis]|uniref:HU family DNA-binding protein n=1 Tax=Iocasia fonsfrigidae TaxID=2682810 RepID=A0A8A7KEY0_9FIRM|nr:MULTISPECIES: HU family DNA-binding protein [Halanaerobiaceae]AZO95359.1 HU family DNA-binding protein [Halocella sp. SP3-1]MTI61116.1 HU family DNA-binding protein [Bacillota bacterium]QTL98238.1 HU family DNA-binding protein [Iocasia fonsfrigidae]
MTKTDLIDAVAEKTGLTKKDSGESVNAVFDTIVDYLSSEAAKQADDRDNVQIIGFGTFEVRDRSSRKGRNPQTGEEITIPARTVPVFRAGKSFKDSVEG